MSSKGNASHIPKDIKEFLCNWLSYLQTLNGLCSTGSRLAHATIAMIQDQTSPFYSMASQCCAAWEHLIVSTAAATASVKSFVFSAFHSNPYCSDPESQAIYKVSQQAIYGSLVTFINLQYQFSVISQEFFVSLSNTHCCRSNEMNHGNHDQDCCVRIIEEGFVHLNPALAPPVINTPPNIVRSPLSLLPTLSQGPQRRWSEAAAGEFGGETAESTLRRWSMPWENTRQNEHGYRWNYPLNSNLKLAVPCFQLQDRSCSTTPDSVSHSGLASQDELQDVIHLLSCQPRGGQSSQSYFSSSPIQISSSQFSPVQPPGAPPSTTTPCSCEYCCRHKTCYGTEDAGSAFSVYGSGNRGAAQMHGDYSHSSYSPGKDHGRTLLSPSVEESSREVCLLVTGLALEDETLEREEALGGSICIDDGPSSFVSQFPG